MIPSKPNTGNILSGINYCFQATKTSSNSLNIAVRKWNYLKDRPKNFISIKDWLKTTKKVEEVTKTATKAKDATDALKAGKWGQLGKFGKFAQLLSIVMSAFGLILGIRNTKDINALSQNIEALEDVSVNVWAAQAAEFERNIRLFKKFDSRLDKVEYQSKINDSNQQVTGLRAQQAFTNSVRARELANDALYEVRQGRVKLEAKIADTNAKYNKFVLDMGVKFAKLQVQFQTQYNNLANQLRNNTGSNGSNVNQGVIQQLQNQISNANKLIDNLTARVNQSLRPQSPQQPQQPQINQTTINQIAQQAATIVRPEIVQIRSENQIIKINLEGFKNVQGSVNSALRSANDNLAQGLTNVAENLVNFKANVARDIETLRKTINRPELQMVDSLARSGVARLVQENIAQQREIQQLTKDLISQNKMNTEGIQKLNQVLTAVNTVGIGVVGVKAVVDGLPAATANRIKPELVPAVQTGICNSANSGCLNGALNNNANNVGNLINAGNNDLFNRLNTLLNGLNLAADGAAMGLLNTINTKLGEQLPNGGIAGKLVRGFQWLKLDRVMNILTFATTIHNAFMLSNSLGQTLMQVTGNMLALIGIKDENGSAFNISEVINSTVENLVKGAIGETEYQVMSENFAKANRIYQAGINVLNSVQNLSSLILQALEIVGSKVALIGNALKAAGAVAERAYGWMNPTPDFENPWMVKLENLNNTANTVGMIVQAPLDVINATKELNESTAELIKAVKDEGEPKQQGIGAEIPDYKALREQQDLAKTNVSNAAKPDLDDVYSGT